MSEKPNILYIHSHDTGRYIQPYGHAVATPHLQALAEGGLLFRQAFCAAPTCSPSRAALLTGQSPHSSGLLGLVHRGFSLNDLSQHVVNTLGPAGYTTTLIGQQHVANDPTEIGYQTIVPTDSNLAESVAPAAVDYLNNAPSEPFFLTVGFFETHREFDIYPTTPEEIRHTKPPLPLPDTAEIRADMAAYNSAARTLDDAVGQVLSALEANGLADNTLVISTTDHGLAFPGMKCNLNDSGIGVSLIMRGPGIPAGQETSALVSHIDIYPTLCEMVSLTPPAWLEGNSLLPIINDIDAEVNEAIFAEVTFHAAYEPMRAIRTKTLKYIRRFDERTKPVLANCDNSPGKELWMAHGWPQHLLASEQLYDLITDPNEAHNLIADPNYQVQADALRAQLASWMEATDDPLRHGPVIPPAGAKSNRLDAISPKEPTYAHPLH